MTLKVLMIPELSAFDSEESGIKRVIEAYHKHLPKYDVQIVGKDSDSYDVVASHAGAYPGSSVVHTHGLYWTADYSAPRWEWAVNHDVITAVRHAKQVTVPSRWVQEVFQRDMRISPTIVPHGIEWQEWAHAEENDKYVLWNKNRASDVCDPAPVKELAQRFPSIQFVATFKPDSSPTNVISVGLLSHKEMKRTVQRAGVYLSTTKETFGIGALEALAAGIPVLGFAYGGNLETVQHGVNGYLARPNDYDDLAEGLLYCMKYRSVLSSNAKVTARAFSWDNACKIVAGVYHLATQEERPTVSIVIPTYNYAEKVGRAIQSAVEQTYEHIDSIVVVDDGSEDNGATERAVANYTSRDSRVKYVRQNNSGVANARNKGISLCNSKYICCLDADDAIKPEFISACVKPLEEDRSLGVAYTGLWYIKKDGEQGLSPWPDAFDYDKQLHKQNQVPTCCVFRRSMWERLGGYKQRYAPGGAGAEDAEFWLRAGAYGYGARKVTDAGLFIYSWQSGRVSGDRNYREVDWTELHPWTKDERHPFASLAKPKNGFSHPVRQYDQPLISVIIPVGEGHEEIIDNALDGLESQTMRKWEAIVVIDSDREVPERIKKAYPYPVFHKLGKSYGAGYARNRGVELARAPLLLFLDADDWLTPTALEDMLTAWTEHNEIVYTDYIGKAQMSEKDARKAEDRLLYYSDKTGEAVISYKALEYSCEKAQHQPDRDMYIWCLISSLVPKVWHDQIGGFDESMVSWEDWDYWIRMARASKCFYHLSKELLVYRFYTGSRRDRGTEDHKNLIKYLLDKYGGDQDSAMPCNCKSRKTSSTLPSSTRVSRTMTTETIISEKKMSDNDFVLIEYTSANRGQHKVVGFATKTVYGYRAGGDTFYVHKRDAEINPEFRVIKVADVSNIVPESNVREETPPPAPVVEKKENPYDKEFDTQLIPGVTPAIALQMQIENIRSLDDIVSVGVDGLMAIKYIGKFKAETIYEYAKQQLEERAEKEL